MDGDTSLPRLSMLKAADVMLSPCSGTMGVFRIVYMAQHNLIKKPWVFIRALNMSPIIYWGYRARVSYSMQPGIRSQSKVRHLYHQDATNS